MNAISNTADGEIFALFRYTTQPEADTDELGRLWMRMYEIATSLGMLATEHFDADGTHLVTYRFPSMHAMTAFTSHPEHRALQRRGAEFFATLHTQICTISRESEFDPHSVSP
jgi:hypothetical protein